MQTECSPTLFEFEPVERHKVVAGFDGGIITSDAGGLLLGRLDRGLGLIRRMASCFTDRRDPRLLEHTVETLVGQRVFALALGYEDLNDHDELRHDPLFHVLAGKLEAKRSDCAPVAGKSTLNRLEHRPRREAGKYHKIDYDAPSLEALFVDIFLDGHKRAPKEIVLDLDATDDTIHGEQEGRFFHGYYDSYCYLPLYIFCGRFLLGAKLRPANIDGAAGAVDEVARIVARIRARWPKGRIVLRGDSGFCREELRSEPNTSPVCVSVFVAAAIAKSRPMETGIFSVRLAIIAYIIPFVFVFNPGLLLQGGVALIINALIASVLGAFILATSLSGYFLSRLSIVERLAGVAVGLGLLIFATHAWLPLIVGAILAAGLFVIHRLRTTRAAAGQSASIG